MNGNQDYNTKDKKEIGWPTTWDRGKVKPVSDISRDIAPGRAKSLGISSRGG